MKIIITLAGNSKRFLDKNYSAAKFTLPVAGKSMLEQILGMFDSKDRFLLVTTHKIFHDNKLFFENICRLYSNITYTLIESHSEGPVKTVIQSEVIKWVGTDCFIISYCDFFLKWNYNEFKNQLLESDPDGCIVVFKGLQPASLGNTYFAYIKEEGGYVTDIKEKESFTENRINEFASAGIYYFKSIEVFLESTYKSQMYFETFSEKYVSLVYKGALDLRKRVSFFEAEKFICLGTPTDYEEFLHWQEVFEKFNSKKNQQMLVSNKLIPMAGFGERFRRAGIQVPKALIPIREKPMFVHAIESQPKANSTFLVVMTDYKRRIENAIANIESAVKIVELDHRTNGMGETVLKALHLIGIDSDILIMSCDYEHFIEVDKFKQALESESVDAVVFYTNFNSMRMQSPNAFAYCQTDEFGIVSRIVEKQCLSEKPWLDKLLVGTFWIRKISDLKHCLISSANQGYLVGGELYIANSLNVLINEGAKIKAIEVDKWVSYGDPRELQIYDWWEDIFLSESLL